MGQVVVLTDSNFDEEVINSSTPVLVDFWAEWCQPCRMISPVVEEIAGEFAGKVKVGKVNVDQNQTTAGKFGITSIPTLLFFKGGEPVDRVVGLQSKDQLVKIIDKIS